MVIKKWMYMAILGIVTLVFFIFGYYYLEQSFVAREELLKKRGKYRGLFHGVLSVTMPDSLIAAEKRNVFYAVGEKGTFLKTEDAGDTWKFSAILPDENLISIHFKNENEGCIVGTNGTLLNTPDGGKTWKKTDLKTDRALGKILFINNDKGFIIGEESLLFCTEDGGKSWKNGLEGITEETYGDPWMLEMFNDIMFANESVGWIVGEAGFIIKTEDGGKTWNQQKIGTTAGLNTIAVLDQDRALVAGEQGELYRTFDGGNTWERKEIKVFELGDEPVKKAIYKIGLLPFGEGGPPLNDVRAWHVYILGDNIGFNSYDFGDSWRTISKDSVLTNYWFYDVLHAGGSLAYMIPKDNYSGTIEELRGSCPLAFMVGIEGKIFRTADKGLLWERMSKFL